MNLHQYDLNLLIIFEMIYTERHLTKAGELLNLSQPAMSQALGRLRDTFQDPLFIRSGKEMLPTACASRIAPQVRQILQLSEQTFLDRGEFDPATSTRTFQLAMNDYAEMVILPRLFNRLQAIAPNIRLESKHLSLDDYQKELEVNELDMVLACSIGGGANVYQQSLFSDQEVVMVRNDSPILQEELTLERYVAHKHAQFLWFNEINEVDQKLKQLKLSRQIVLEVQHEMVLPLVLRDNELLVNMPKRMATVFKEMLPLEILEIPLPLSQYTFRQYWHECNHHDPAHQWLRSEMRKTAETL